MIAVRLRRAAAADHPALAAVKLAPGQEPFVGLFADWPEETRDPRHLHVVEAAGRPVGFFRIDPAFRARIPALPEGAHGLRGLLIDAASQGRGIGRAAFAALPAHLRDGYPGLARVWLSVDLANLPARELYRRAGWVPDGPPVPGRSGPEAVLRLDL